MERKTKSLTLLARSHTTAGFGRPVSVVANYTYLTGGVACGFLMARGSPGLRTGVWGDGSGVVTGGVVTGGAGGVVVGGVVGVAAVGGAVGRRGRGRVGKAGVPVVGVGAGVGGRYTAPGPAGVVGRATGGPAGAGVAGAGGVSGRTTTGAAGVRAGGLAGTGTYTVVGGCGAGAVPACVAGELGPELTVIVQALDADNSNPKTPT